MKDVELRHLRCFVAVAEELPCGRAAGRVSIARRPLSQPDPSPMPRRAVLSFACLSVTLAACASVPESKESFVVLESSKFT